MGAFCAHSEEFREVTKYNKIIFELPIFDTIFYITITDLRGIKALKLQFCMIN
jgi:hypothetical protein